MPAFQASPGPMAPPPMGAAPPLGLPSGYLPAPGLPHNPMMGGADVAMAPPGTPCAPLPGPSPMCGVAPERSPMVGGSPACSCATPLSMPIAAPAPSPYAAGDTSLFGLTSHLEGVKREAHHAGAQRQDVLELKKVRDMSYLDASCRLGDRMTSSEKVRLELAEHTREIEITKDRTCSILGLVTTELKQLEDQRSRERAAEIAASDRIAQELRTLEAAEQSLKATQLDELRKKATALSEMKLMLGAERMCLSDSTGIINKERQHSEEDFRQHAGRVSFLERELERNRSDLAIRRQAVESFDMEATQFYSNFSADIQPPLLALSHR